MKAGLRKKEKYAVWVIVLFYCFYTQFFSASFFVNMHIYKDLVTIVDLFICAMFVPYMIRSHKDVVSRQVWILCLMFVFGLIWGWLYWDEGLYTGLKATFRAQGVFTLLFYFIYKKFQVSYLTLTKVIFSIAIIYSSCYIIGVLTYPNQIFGASLNFDESSFEKTLEDRGVLRLFLQGADFIVIAIFYLLVRFREKKICYLWLIPLFIMLVLRGTRTPLIVTGLMCLLYYLKSIKNKVLSVSIFVIAILSFNVVNEALLNSNSDNPIVKYVQLTSAQMENNDNKGEEDIRVQMSKYMLTELDANDPVCIFIGNGIPSAGRLQARLAALENDNSFWVVDVGFIVIFVYFGLVGLFIYLGLLVMIIKLKVDAKYYFAKLYLFYLYLILPTNCSLITLSSFMVALALYILYLGNQERISKNVITK